MSIRMIVALLLFAVVLAGCTAVQSNASGAAPIGAQTDQSSAELVDLVDLSVCASAATGIGNWLFAYTSATGLFEKYGLRVTAHEITSGSDAMAALLAGDVDICQVAGSAVVNAALAVDEPVIVAGLINRQPYSLVVASDIDEPADLKGKALAVSKPGSGSDTVLRAALQSLGLEPDVDVTIVSVGGQAERLAAMESGQVAGTVFSLAELGNALQAGYRVLVDAAELDFAYQHTSVGTTRTFLAENRSTVEKYLRALLEARARMERDQEQGPRIIATEFLVDSEQEVDNIRETYGAIVQLYTKDLQPTRDGVAALIEEGRKENLTARDITVDDIIDDSIVQELERNGFIAGLYPQ